jgi:hypothetical protein
MHGLLIFLSQVVKGSGTGTPLYLRMSSSHPIDFDKIKVVPSQRNLQTKRKACMPKPNYS